MTPAGLEPAIPASERPQTDALHRVATGIGSILIQGVPGGKVNILGGHSIRHSKQKCLYEHVSNSERFPR